MADIVNIERKHAQIQELVDYIQRRVSVFGKDKRITKAAALRTILNDRGCISKMYSVFGNEPKENWPFICLLMTAHSVVEERFNDQ